MSPAVWRFILFGILGIFGEVVFTSLLGLARARSLRLQGSSFLWMFPIYGLLAIVFPPVAGLVAPLPWYLRGLIYMAGIYLVEFVTGSLLTALIREHVWRYTDRWSYKGQITLTHAPVWFALGLVVERYYPWMEKMGRLLASS